MKFCYIALGVGYYWETCTNQAQEERGGWEGKGSKEEEG